MTEGACPSCGAPIRFTAGSARVVICAHCRTVVGRSDVGLATRGKVAAIVDTESPLSLGVHGKFGDQGFRIVGRLQKDYGAGPWDEWYLELSSREQGSITHPAQTGDRAWLSESEGEWHLMVQRQDQELSFATLEPDAAVTIVGRPFRVEELGESTTVAAEGELPSDLDPSLKDRYADCTSAGGGFATLDFGTGEARAEVFLGRRVTLAELQIPSDQLRPRPKREALRQARCPRCNGPLDLRAPDRALRVGCPYCGALLDVSHGKLEFLQALGKPELEPLIPLGKKGTLDGVQWICIAFLARHCDVEGQRYPWTEALLFEAAHGFAWLVESNGHWELLRPVAAGDVATHARYLTYAGHIHRRYQGAQAITDYVLGECYWAVAQGETSVAEEFIAPPLTVNRERNDREVTYVAGHYVERDVLQKAFGLASLPASTGIGAAQPNLYKARARSAMRWLAVYGLAVVALYVVASVLAAQETVLNESATLTAGLAPGSAESMHFFGPFELRRDGNLEATVSTEPLYNDWLGLDLDLVNDETGEVTSFYQELSFYSGYDSDGAWTEGSRSGSEYVSRVPRGRYVLRVTPWFQGPTNQTNRTYGVVLESDAPRFLWVIVALALLSLWPIWVQFRVSRFEQARWEEA